MADWLIRCYPRTQASLQDFPLTLPMSSLVEWVELADLSLKCSLIEAQSISYSFRVAQQLKKALRFCSKSSEKLAAM